MKRGPARLLLGGLLLGVPAARAGGRVGPKASPSRTAIAAENYRSPTPPRLRGARVSLRRRMPRRSGRAGNAIFLDVMPHAPRPANLPPGTIWREKPRRNIPGSVWLPDTGYGALAPPTENYLRSNLARLTGGDKARMLVDLLPARLLDVVERGEAHPRDGVPQCRVVPGRHRRLGGGAAAAGGIARPPVPRRERVSYSIACWIARPSANRRCSISTGTSQTKRIVLAAVLEDARVPLDLLATARASLADRRRLHPAARAARRCRSGACSASSLLAAGVALDAVHHLGALAVEPVEQSGEQQLARFCSRCRCAAGDEFGDRLLGASSSGTRRAARRAHQILDLRHRSPTRLPTSSSGGPAHTAATEISGTLACTHGQSGWRGSAARAGVRDRRSAMSDRRKEKRNVSCHPSPPPRRAMKPREGS